MYISKTCNIYMTEPTNKRLYNRIKNQVVKEYPKNSAYRSGIKEKKYKAAGGGYKGKKPKSSKLNKAIKKVSGKKY